MSLPARSPAQDRWLRLFNRLLYAKLPALYNALDIGTLGAWWRLVRRALDYVPAQGRVLEIGFGPGRLHVELARRVDACHGLDLASGMCRFTRQRLARAGLSSRIVRGSVFALPYADDAFHTVVSTFAFSGFPDGERAMAELSRVTRPAGRVVLVDIGPPRDGNPLGLLLARLWQSLGDFLYDQPAMMRAAGLKLLAFNEFGLGRHIRAVVGLKPTA